MADFNQHIIQAKSNLSFLSKVSDFNNHWDWKVTVSFYVSLHLINAHIAKTTDDHYRKHIDVERAINPNRNDSAKIEPDQFVSYKMLSNLSRRSRYLVHEKPSEADSIPHFTYEKHLAKAIRHLDKMMHYFDKKYGIEFGKISIKCDHLKEADNLSYFIKSSN